MSVSIDKDPADEGDARARARQLAGRLCRRPLRPCGHAGVLSVGLPQQSRRALGCARAARPVSAPRPHRRGAGALAEGRHRAAGVRQRQPDRCAAARSDRSDARHDRLALAQAASPRTSQSQTADVEPPFVDPTLFRRDFDPADASAHAARCAKRCKQRRAQDAVQGARAAEVRQKDVLRDRYELLSILGRGSSGTVYRALDRHRAHCRRSALRRGEGSEARLPQPAGGARRAGARVPPGAVAVASERRQRVRSRPRRRHIFHRDGAARRRAARQTSCRACDGADAARARARASSAASARRSRMRIGATSFMPISSRATS